MDKTSRTAFLLFPTLTSGCLVAGSAFAHELSLRGVKIGEPCRQAANLELAQHGRPVSPVEQMLAGRIMGFNEDTTEGESKLILYSCDERGNVASYSIDTATHDESVARALYAGTKADFVSRFGEPYSDSERFNPVQKQLLERLALSANAMWQKEEDESLSVSLSTPAAKGEWRVSVRVSLSRQIRTKHPAG
jgi:hypothetical protein